MARSRSSSANSSNAPARDRGPRGSVRQVQIANDDQHGNVLVALRAPLPSREGHGEGGPVEAWPPPPWRLAPLMATSILSAWKGRPHETDLAKVLARPRLADRSIGGTQLRFRPRRGNPSCGSSAAAPATESAETRIGTSARRAPRASRRRAARTGARVARPVLESRMPQPLEAPIRRSPRRAE